MKFRMPTAMKITGRTSSITNAFFNGIIPVIQPTDSEVDNVLNILGIDPNHVTCCYCGNEVTEWDHFRPLVVDKKPTGYITEIANLVPCCGKCNQSKGNREWSEWIISEANLSPKTRGVKDIDERIKRLKDFERISKPQKIDIINIIGKELWDKYMEDYDKIMQMMKDCQLTADKIKDKIKNYVRQ